MFEQTFRNIDDVLWKEAGCATELDYTEQTSWMLFLKYLEDLEHERAQEAELVGKPYSYVIDAPYRWSAWAAPKTTDGAFDHDRALTGADLIAFVNGTLFPYLRGFRARAGGADTLEYRIGEIFSEIRNKFASGYSLRDALELIDGLSFRSQSEKHELSHLYEAKIKNMGNAGRNGGEYYTPRPLIRAMIRVIKPNIGERIYDAAAGSAGFLCEAHDYLRYGADGQGDGSHLSTADLDLLQKRTFYAKEKKSLPYVIGIMNMILHGIETPNIVHTNSLTENLADIQEKDRFDVILANPPFGGKERKEVQQNFPIKTGETAFLFLQHFIKYLKAGGRAAIVIKNTFLSNSDNAARALRKELLRSCSLHTILDCPGGTFLGAGVKTVVLFFEKGAPTRKVWYYQLDPGRNMGKTNPLNDKDLADFVDRQANFEETENSWTVDVTGIDADSVNLSVNNPNKAEAPPLRGPEVIINEIETLDKQSEQILKGIRDLNSAFCRQWEAGIVKPLEDICSFSSGGTPPKRETRFWTGEIPWISGRDMKSTRLCDSLLHVSQAAVDESATRLAPVGSLLMLVRGMGLAHGAQIAELAAPCAFNQDIKGIHPEIGLIPRYLVFALRYFVNASENVISSAAHGTLKIDMEVLRKIEIPVPPYEVQKQIVAGFDALTGETKRLELNYQRKLAALADLNQSLMQRAFSGELAAGEEVEYATLKIDDVA